MEEIDLKELFMFFLSKIYIVVIAIIIVVAGGNIYNILTRKPLYQSNTTIVLANEKQTASQLTINQSLVATYSEIAKSRTVLKNVKNNLKLDYSIAKLASEIAVSNVTETQIIKITVTDENNKRAKKIANEIVPAFFKEVQRIYKIDNVHIVDKANTSKKPSNVNYIKENIKYILAGIILGFGIEFCMFYFDNSIKSVKDIEDKEDITVLGVVPKINKRK